MWFIYWGLDKALARKQVPQLKKNLKPSTKVFFLEFSLVSTFYGPKTALLWE